MFFIRIYSILFFILIILFFLFSTFPRNARRRPIRSYLPDYHLNRRVLRKDESRFCKQLKYNSGDMKSLRLDVTDD